ncbi:MAG: ABC transporter substrate-binding protein [Gaiellales bacterium]
MEIDHQRIDPVRARHGEIENHVIDEFLAGRLSRRDFLRRGSIVGISIPALSAIVAACGGANSSSSSSSSGSTPSGAKKSPGTLKVAGTVPAAAINPITVEDEGGLTMLQQAGEYLVLDNPQTFQAQPMLATSWTPNSDGTQWTFKLRPGVKFHNGKPMTADDVVYTFKQQSNPAGKGNALSVYTGLLVPDGVSKVDDQTVMFHLEAATGAFPYLISTDNYNSIIVPNGTDFAGWEKTFMGTGPFVLQKYQAKQGATFTANPHWWKGKVGPTGIEWTFYATQPPQILALQGGQVDAINDFAYQGAQALFNNPSYHIIDDHTSQHRELSMRCDQPPFNDNRVRQAIALTLDRPAIASALFGKYAQIGNDSPFAPIFPTTGNSVPQRTQDLVKAKQLLKEAGHANGFSATLYTENYQELPQLAQIVKESASKIGVNLTLNVSDQNTYYSKYWLTGQMSLVDYGHRGVPNVFLNATLTSKGAWNAAHFKNPTYDSLYKQFVATVDLQTQKTLAAKIQRLLLDQSPIIIPYFFDELSASKPSVGGIVTTGMGQMFAGQAYAM